MESSEFPVQGSELRVSRLEIVTLSDEIVTLSGVEGHGVESFNREPGTWN